MPRPPRSRKILTEDLPSEHAEWMDALLGSLNNFMDDTVKLFSGRIDDENLAASTREITVDFDGETLNLFKYGMGYPTRRQSSWGRPGSMKKVFYLLE